MDILNNREIAYLFWGSIILLWFLKTDKRQDLLAHLFVTAFSKPLLKIYAAMFSYIAVLVYSLHEIGVWEISQTKSTVVWSFSVALIAVFRIRSIKENPHYFKQSLGDSLSLIVVLEFVMTFYSFNLIAELIFLPVMAFLGGMKALSERDEKYKVVDKLLDGIFIIFAILMLIYAAHNIIIGLSEFFAAETLTDFLTPIVLSVLYLPFIYALAVYESYERRFATIKFKIPDAKLRRYAKIRSIFAFHINWKLLDRWFDHLNHIRPASKKDINYSIREVKSLAAYEKNPKEVPIEEGWSPYEAKDFLQGFGIKTGYYKSIGDPEWFASSNSLEVGPRFSNNTIFYYVSGTQFAAKSLKLKLYIFQPEDGIEALDRFLEIANDLLLKALKVEIVNDFKSAIKEGHDAQGVFENKTIKITREDWPNSKNGQYDLVFHIQSP